MINRHRLSGVIAGLLGFIAVGSDLRAEITVRLSVKFILLPNGTRPSGDSSRIDISTIAGFNAELDRGNRALAGSGRGFRLEVVEFLDIQPVAPANQPANYWFNLDARANRGVFEAAALADRAAWRWSTDAVNIYINNSSSGSCSLNGGSSISLGGTLFAAGTVVHELGHFFGLAHTHSGDPDCSSTTNPQPADGDQLAETIADHVCLDRDGLSQIHFGGRLFTALEPFEQARVNSSWLNVMSYHREEQLLGDQMDLWTAKANANRIGFCRGRTWFVAEGGSDGASGVIADSPLRTLTRALTRVQGEDDVVLLRSGTYQPPSSGIITTPSSLRATRGDVTLTRP